MMHTGCGIAIYDTHRTCQVQNVEHAGTSLRRAAGCDLVLPEVIFFLPSSARGDLLVSRKLDIKLPGKVDSNSHGTRPVHLIIRMMKQTQTSRLSMKNSLSPYYDGLSSGRGNTISETVTRR